jgi:hypothetical protein
MSAGPCGWAEMQWKCLLGIQFICMAKRDFAIHLITLHNILEYIQIAIIQTEKKSLVSLNFWQQPFQLAQKAMAND